MLSARSIIPRIIIAMFLLTLCGFILIKPSLKRVSAQSAPQAQSPEAPLATSICVSNSGIEPQLDGTELTSDRPNLSTACPTCGASGNVVPFDAYGFNISGCAGTITVTATTCVSATCAGAVGTGTIATNGRPIIYQKAGGAAGTAGSPIFDRTNACTNYITGNDSNTCGSTGRTVVTSPTCPLVSGNFVVIVAEAASGSTGTYNLQVSVTGCTAVTRISSPTAADGLVSGRITSNDGSSLEGTVVNLGGAQSRKTITDENGNYHFTNVEANGFYTLTPSRANYGFNPADRSFSLVGNQTEAAFTGISTGDAANPLDTAEYFVRQQYLDFLDRGPDERGFNFWSDRILECGGDTNCVAARRKDVAAAFFISNEFQNSGYFVYRLYKGAFGARPTFAQYLPDRNRVIGGASLDAARSALADDFVRRGEFLQAYPDSLSNEQFVNQLYDTAGLFPYTVQRQIEIDKLNHNGTRSQMLQDLVDGAQFKAAEYNPAFVLTEYFNYLRRGPDAGGYGFWLNVLNTGDANNYRGMVCSFITSAEYQRRFSVVVSHSNAECGQ